MHVQGGACRELPVRPELAGLLPYPVILLALPAPCSVTAASSPGRRGEARRGGGRARGLCWAALPKAARCRAAGTRHSGTAAAGALTGSARRESSVTAARTEPGRENRP